MAADGVGYTGLLPVMPSRNYLLKEGKAITLDGTESQVDRVELRDEPRWNRSKPWPAQGPWSQPSTLPSPSPSGGLHARLVACPLEAASVDSVFVLWDDGWKRGGVGMTS
jgi:hypothetical protein